MNVVLVSPLPDHVGMGFCSYYQVPGTERYRYEPSHRYHNYHFTPERWKWLDTPDTTKCVRVDGFSPNLNKKLHVGHLRNLALANSLSRIFATSRFVALLGKSLGVLDNAQEELYNWFRWLGYSPDIYFDVDLGNDIPLDELKEGGNEFQGCKMYHGPSGPVVAVRTDGRPTYAGYDLAFARKVSPTHYITGAEQSEHFASLGLKDRHLAMGLVLDKDKKKMKSRTGDAFSADEAMKAVMDCLQDTPSRKELAWNILCWNFLHTRKSQSIQFDEKKWTEDHAPGLYITYTYARCLAALKGDLNQTCDEVTNSELKLLGTSEYFKYWLQWAIEIMDPVVLANYAHNLARVMSNSYHSEKIVGGRQAWRFAMAYATATLEKTMKLLGMVPLTVV